MNCRGCQFPLVHGFLDLGFAPPSNAYLTAEDLVAPEKYFPLKLMVCDHCWLVQTLDYARASELFNADYAYFSSTSTTWLKHAADYSAAITRRLGLNSGSLVVEVAANDGYLLKNFLQAGIPCLGIEPTASTASAAEQIGIPVIREFFGANLASQLRAQGRSADLIAGNNVYAHVPDINDFTLGLATLLKSGGTVTLEFPHLMQLLRHSQFDTVYHEHFSYLSLYTAADIFRRAGLRIFDVEELPTHGGSLRVYGCLESDPRVATAAVGKLIAQEESEGLRKLATYLAFQPGADRIKDDLLEFLIDTRRAKASVCAYGAAAKGNTLLNYAGVKPDLLPFVCDAAPAKQGKYMPGSHIPILSPQAIAARRPDFIVILPWNLSDEVMEQLSFARSWGAQFVTAVPRLAIR